MDQWNNVVQSMARVNGGTSGVNASPTTLEEHAKELDGTFLQLDVTPPGTTRTVALTTNACVKIRVQSMAGANNVRTMNGYTTELPDSG